MRDLQRGGANTNQIARALVDQKLVEGPVKYAETLGGSAGSPKERQLFEMLNAGGANTQRIHDLMQTGRELTLQIGLGKQNFPKMRLGQLLLRPFRTLDMMMTGATEKQVQQEIAALLAHPTREGLARLREISMFDPSVRKQLSAASGLIGAESAMKD
jgi:hypothetical protein